MRGQRRKARRAKLPIWYPAFAVNGQRDTTADEHDAAAPASKTGEVTGRRRGGRVARGGGAAHHGNRRRANAGDTGDAGATASPDSLRPHRAWSPTPTRRSRPTPARRRRRSTRPAARRRWRRRHAPRCTRRAASLTRTAARNPTLYPNGPAGPRGYVGNSKEAAGRVGAAGHGRRRVAIGNCRSPTPCPSRTSAGWSRVSKTASPTATTSRSPRWAPWTNTAGRSSASRWWATTRRYIQGALEQAGRFRPVGPAGGPDRLPGGFAVEEGVAGCESLIKAKDQKDRNPRSFSSPATRHRQARHPCPDEPRARQHDPAGAGADHPARAERPPADGHAASITRVKVSRRLVDRGRVHHDHGHAGPADRRPQRPQALGRDDADEADQER